MDDSAKLKTYLLLAAFSLTMVSTALAGIIYVDTNAPGANDGSSWTDAYNYLQDALADANSSDKPVEIRVAHGIYRPDETSAEPNGTGDRTATFQLINGVTLKGGYAGFDESDPNSRDVNLYETVLSGDLNGNDVNISDPLDLIDEPTRVENSLHVITSDKADANAVLDGFSIIGGNAGGPYPHYHGGGVYNDAGRPSLINCIISGNTSGAGGGMFNGQDGSPTLTNCTFIKNYARQGGGMCNYGNPTLVRCTFSENVVSGKISANGGGMSGSGILTHCIFTGNIARNGGGLAGGGTLTNCIFIGNSATQYGGGLYYTHNSLDLSNCVFRDNSAGRGGGMFSTGYSRATLTNCVFSNNSATGGYGGGICNDYSTPILTNCTFIQNSVRGQGGGMSNDNSKPTLDYCIFFRNSSDNAGGAMFNNNGSMPMLTNCVFTENSGINDGGAIANFDCRLGADKCEFDRNSARFGGAMRNFWSTSTLSNCTFSNNSAECGGAINNVSNYHIFYSILFTNCLFKSNSALVIGGGLFNSDCSPTLTNCTFTANSAINGNALACDSYQQNYPSNVQITNCIIWDSGDQIWNNDNSAIIIAYSNIQGGWPGEGNIDYEPLFVDPGYWDPNGTPADVNDDFWIDGDYHLLSDSPCIDTGDPNYIVKPDETDLDGNPRVIGGRIDMGAYEYSPPISAEVRIVPRTINLQSKGIMLLILIRPAFFLRMRLNRSGYGSTKKNKLR